MNERGQSALIHAQMQGVKQIKGRLWDGQGGFCAGGVLLKELGGGVGLFASVADFADAYAAFGMTPEEWVEMVLMNNRGADFIKIARELANTEGR